MLRLLFATNSFVRDEDLAHLSSLTALKELYIGRNDVSDEGLQHLAGLVNLEILSVGNNEKVSGQAFRTWRQ